MPRETPISIRVSRLVALLLHLMRVWFCARFVFPLIGLRRRTTMTSRWARRMLQILNLKISVVGKLPEPAMPTLLVANHISWLDMYTLNTIDNWRFVAKSEVAGWPIIGIMAKQLGSIFHQRGNFRDAMRVKNSVAQLLRRGVRIAVFPEGTTTEGRRIQFFLPRAFSSRCRCGSDGAAGRDSLPRRARKIYRGPGLCRRHFVTAIDRSDSAPIRAANRDNFLRADSGLRNRSHDVGRGRAKEHRRCPRGSRSSAAAAQEPRARSRSGRVPPTVVRCLRAFDHRPRRRASHTEMSYSSMLGIGVAPRALDS